MTAINVYAPPSSDEWSMINHQAEVLSKSAIVPQAFRGKPADIIVATLTARELGIGPMAALNHIAVINGKATLSAEGMVALVRSRGHSISGTASDTEATVTGTRADNGDTLTVTFTMQDATRANLLKNAVWKQYPSDMLWARSVSKLCRRLFSDVISGLSYTPEEAESFSGTPHAPDGGGEQAPTPTVEPAPPTTVAEGEVATGEGATSSEEDIEDAEVIEDDDPVVLDKAERARLIGVLHGIWRHLALSYSDDPEQRIKRWMIDKYGVSLSELPDGKLVSLHAALTRGGTIEREVSRDRFKAAVTEWGEANPLPEEVE